jgi:hypothetical protein
MWTRCINEDSLDVLEGGPDGRHFEPVPLEIEYLSGAASDAMKGAPVGSLLLTYR